ncbi:hypothetical protein J6590_001362 [Homalodisca vitripennis]|nr:hypothetical protein J6590_001362 [Homalodisca vitripennis]
MSNILATYCKDLLPTPECNDVGADAGRREAKANGLCIIDDCRPEWTFIDCKFFSGLTFKTSKPKLKLKFRKKNTAYETR